MGIIFVALTAEDEMLDRVFNDPPLIWRLYDPEAESLYLDEIGANKKPGFLGKLFGAKVTPAPDTLPSFEYLDDHRKEIDLDKSWDGLNFCFKELGITDPLNIFESGKPVGHVDVGYGPAMAFYSADVRKMAEKINAISEDKLLEAFSPVDMNDVYPDGMWSSGEDDNVEYLVDNFTELQDFVKFANDRNLGIVVIYS